MHYAFFDKNLLKLLQYENKKLFTEDLADDIPEFGYC